LLGEELAGRQGSEGCSEWGYIWLVTGHHGVSQGSILRPMLFNILINDPDAGVECTINKFAADTELGGAVDSLEGEEALQRDLDRLEHWAVINSTKLNKNKHEILHLGQDISTSWEGIGWRAALQKGIWGGLVGSRLSGSQQRALAAKGPNPILGQDQPVKSGGHPAVFSAGAASP